MKKRIFSSRIVTGRDIVRSHDTKGINITFDSETFDCISKRARKENRSFASEVRLLVEWGLESERQAQ